MEESMIRDRVVVGVKDNYTRHKLLQGHLQGDVHLQVNEKVPPVQMPLRRLPLGVRDKVDAELRRLEDLGVIESVSEPSPWISALLVVAKPDGRIRICIDPKPL